MMFISNDNSDLVGRRSANEFLSRKMVPFVCFLWFSVSGFMFYLISLVSRYIFRFHGEHGSQKDNDSNPSTAQPEITKFEDSNSDEPGEKDIPKFCFKFQTLHDSKGGNEESEGSVHTGEKAPMVSTSKYQFVSGKDFCGFVEEPEVLSFTVNELYADSNYGSFSNKEIIDEGFLSGKDLPQLNSGLEAVEEEIVENSTDSHCKAGETEPETMTREQLSGSKEVIDDEFLSEKNLLQLDSEAEAVQEEIVENSSIDSHCKAGETEPATLTQEQEQLSGKEELVGSEVHLQNMEDDPTEVQVLGEEDFCTLDSDLESISLSDEFSLENLSIHLTDGFLSDRDFENPSHTETLLDDFNEQSIESSEETLLQNSNMVSNETIDTGDQSSSSVNPIRVRGESELFHREKGLISEEQTNFIEIVSESDKDDDEEEEEEEAKHEDFDGGDEKETMDFSAKIEKPNKQNMQNSSIPGPEDENELETLWEHQDLIEQLKMEIKKVRATGLPTILEESESPRMMEDLKPWKIDEKFLHEDRMDELHKFYKSYSERMRKFDILNYQKMYAIGFLQLKDPLQSISNRKSSIPSILSHNFWLGKCQRAKVDPTVKFMGELQSDLEMVYVGHMCLSWEILHWQFGKSHELQESDPYGFHRYNQVAGEFQQFQVLMQRFLEDEAFQAPRIQNYVKNRCVLRNLLQVPVIKEDSYKDKKKSKQGGGDAITIPMLTVIIEESMHIFWEFVKADKNEGTGILKDLWRTQVELQNPADMELLTEIRRNVQKKEKKLKDILRTGNCIVKKFQKKHEDRSDLISFFSQVDMKLISRVLNMSRITSEQLVWCHKKLNKINFVDRKIHREPSFLLFPC